MILMQAETRPIDDVLQLLIEEMEIIKATDLELFEKLSQFGNLLFESGNFFLELSRFKRNDSAAGAGNLTVSFYPSNGLLMFARAVLARDFDLLSVDG